MLGKIAGTALVATALMAGSAQAADIPVKAVRPMVPVQFSWTGFYIGGHIGAVRDRSTFDGVFNEALFPGFISIGGIPALAPIVLVPTRLASLPGATTNKTGVIGGGQFGYNWQIGSSFLLGFEGDISGTGVRSSAVVSPVDPFGFATLTGTYSTDTKWMASLRGRLGLTFDRVLVYATGGAAFASYNVGQTFTLVNPTPGIFFPNPGSSGTTAVGYSFTDVGWTLGGGLEWAIGNNWSIAGEYRHSRFPSHRIALASSDPSGQLGFTPIFTTVRLTNDQATFRVNYRFGAN